MATHPWRNEGPSAAGWAHSGEEQHVDDGAEGMRHILSTRSGGPVESGGSERRSGARWGQSAGVVEVRGSWEAKK